MQEEFERSAGILMPVSSLPSPYGIGTFGEEAYRFVDDLAKARQKYWQVLPLGPTSYGDSPYSSFSAFAGNPYFIDLDVLIEEGLLEKEYVESFDWGDDPENIDYGLLYESRFIVLKEAYKNSDHKDTDEYAEFLKKNKDWLEGYCQFRACKIKFDGVSWQEWDDDVKFREKDAIEKYSKELEDDIEFFKFIQFKFFEQWYKLKKYANDKEIRIIGDIPIYVAMDSADVWQNPELFLLDEDLNPESVAGVPPDAFSDMGQLWGNPLYDWEKMEKEDFSWWRKRMFHLAKMYDVIRIDHFIGTVKYYSVPAEDDDARNGRWNKGPGMKLLKAIDESVGDKKIIAEDLGVKIPEVVGALKKIGYPGMKVLEFAFNGDRGNEHLPYNWSPNMVVYGGTHDNDTLVGYLSGQNSWEQGYIREYLECRDGDVCDLVDELFKEAYESVARLVIFQMQDVLKIGSEGRENVPSTIGTNWKWRMQKDKFGAEEIERLRYLCDIYGR